MSRGQIKTTITTGQRYVDEPIVEVMKPKAELTTVLAESVGAVFGRRAPREIRQVVGFERVRLRWMKPDGKGGLVEKKR